MCLIRTTIAQATHSVIHIIMLHTMLMLHGSSIGPHRMVVPVMDARWCHLILMIVLVLMMWVRIVGVVLIWILPIFPDKPAPIGLLRAPPTMKILHRGKREKRRVSWSIAFSIVVSIISLRSSLFTRIRIVLRGGPQFTMITRR